MKTILAFLSLACAAHALDIPIVEEKIVYRDCVNLRVQGDELLFVHAEGSARVRFDKLPSALQAKHFNPAKVAAIAAQRKASEEKQRQQRAAEDQARIAKEKQDRHRAAIDAELAKRTAEMKIAEDAKRDALAGAKQARMENVRAGKWQRFIATMLAKTATGQIMRSPDERFIHVVGELGRALDEECAGYFERAGHYIYTVNGVDLRLNNYEFRADASKDMDDDLDELERMEQELVDLVKRRQPLAEAEAKWKNLRDLLSKQGARLIR